MKKIIRKIASIILGRTYSQSFFERLYKVTLRGMNFGLSEVNESGELSVLAHLAKKVASSQGTGTITVFDVGANKGDYAIAINTVLGERASIYSFEPSKPTFFELKKNTAKIPSIHLYNSGLSSKPQNLDLYYDNKGSGLASVYKRGLASIEMSEKEEVSFTTLDIFCKENSIDRIDLLKMDVEGHELDILKGAEETLASGKIKSLQFEFGGCNIDSRTYFKDFHKLLCNKYRIYRVLQNGLREIKSYSEFDEIFTTVNYFAELK
jgi:FkbM family methyltransferase